MTPLFDTTPAPSGLQCVKNARDFDGKTYDPTKDGERLETLLSKVSGLMKDGQWRTLAEIHGLVGGSEAGISARLRDLRKPKFGEHEVGRRRRSVGLWEYRLGQRKGGAE